MQAWTSAVTCAQTPAGTSATADRECLAAGGAAQQLPTTHGTCILAEGRSAGTGRPHPVPKPCCLLALPAQHAGVVRPASPGRCVCTANARRSPAPGVSIGLTVCVQAPRGCELAAVIALGKRQLPFPRRSLILQACATAMACASRPPTTTVSPKRSLATAAEPSAAHLPSTHAPALHFQLPPNQNNSGAPPSCGATPPYKRAAFCLRGVGCSITSE